jgi:hypothetical protein
MHELLEAARIDIAMLLLVRKQMMTHWEHVDDAFGTKVGPFVRPTGS